MRDVPEFMSLPMMGLVLALSSLAATLMETKPMTNIFSAALALLTLASAWSQTNLDFKRTEDVIYGRKYGTALTFDVFQPTNTNGLGIILMVSGGWFSAHEVITPDLFRPLLARGYTVFTVVHRSPPKFAINPHKTDIHRAVDHGEH